MRAMLQKNWPECLQNIHGMKDTDRGTVPDWKRPKEHDPHFGLDPSWGKKNKNKNFLLFCKSVRTIGELNKVCRLDNCVIPLLIS